MGIGQFVAVSDLTAGNLQFVPNANINGSPLSSFTFQVQDNGGADNGGVDLSVTPNTLTINVTSVNNPPVGTANTVTTNEDVSYQFAAADFGFGDPNDSPADGFKGVRISSLPLAGTLTINGLTVTQAQVTAGTAFASLAAINGGNFRFTSATNANGPAYASFTFQVQDTGGVLNGGIDLDPTPRSMTVNVTPVNDAPTGQNNTRTTLEDQPLTFAVADFGFSDSSDNSPPSSIQPNAFQAVRITSLPTTGSLTNNGVAVAVGDSVPLANISGNLLVFTPALNANGSPYASFRFQVQDSGGLANNGADTDPTPKTMSINVTSVNDAPSGTSKTVQVNTGATGRSRRRLRLQRRQ